MYRVAVVLFIIFLGGCATTDTGNVGYTDTLATAQNDNTSIDDYDITYEVKHTHFDNADNPFDVYSVKFHEDPQYTVELLKYDSERDPNYNITVTYTGNQQLPKRGTITIDIDGFISTYGFNDTFNDELPSGKTMQITTVILNKFTVYDLQAAVNMRIGYQFLDPIAITPEGIENIKRFVTEMEGI